MYASKFPTERYPVAKCVMIAEANTDAPKSFCDAPDGTGHRDMARSESSRMAKFPNLALTRRRVYIEKANGKLRPLTHYGLYRLAWADVRRAR